MQILRVAVPCVLLAVGGCATTAPPDAKGKRATYEDVSTSSESLQGVGMESQDIVAMTDKMMRDMLTAPDLAARNPPPRVIIDSEYFYNESSSRVNKNLITDRLRIELNRAARGKMTFIGRHFANMVESERQLKREGQVDVGTTGLTKAAAGGDFRLGGRIASLDTVDPKSGMQLRYQQITFEMVDLETGAIPWSGIYEFKKSAQDDLIYR